LDTFDVRLAGPFVVVEQVYPVLVAAIALHAVPCGTPDLEKFPEASAVTLVPQTFTVAPFAFAPKLPETA
jgi:hypothetical protein